MKEVTLKQIAENLGISVTTVSKALKDYSDVSKKTKQLVKDEAKKLQYKPNVFAVNLRTKESKTVGLIIPEVVHHFFSSVINGIIEEAEKKGYLVIILQSNESYKLEKKQVDLLISKRVDGIMMSMANTTVDISHLQEIQRHDIPLVMFDKISKLMPCSKVVINDRKAAYDATKHLIDCGCKHIVHFRGALLPQNSIDRFLGYKKEEIKGNIVVAPPSAHGTPWIKKMVPYVTASASGWMTFRGARRRRAIDRGFVLSDHCDWQGLLSSIKETGAEKIICTHGYTDIFSRYLREIGYDARTEQTQYEEENAEQTSKPEDE